MPEESDHYEVYSREYYWSPAYRFFLKEYFQGNEWKKITDRKTKDGICRAIVTTKNYLWEEECDASKEQTIRFLKPAETIFEGMGLEYSSEEGEFVKNEKRICFDPSVNSPSPSCLLVRKEEFLEFLNENDLAIIWTMIGEKQLIGGHSRLEEFPVMLKISGFYYLENNSIKGKFEAKLPKSK